MTFPPSNSSLNLLLYLQETVRHLTHQLRTPLAVVANDLAYLQHTTKDPNLERPLRRTKEISELLATTQFFLLLPLAHDTEQACKEFVDAPLGEEAPHLLGAALGRLEEYLSGRFAQLNKRYEVKPTTLTLILEAFQEHAPSLPEDADFVKEKSVLNWLKRLGLSASFEVVLFDAAIEAHKGEGEIVGDNLAVTITMNFPR
jgi:signal transduction histidine kinase